MPCRGDFFYPGFTEFVAHLMTADIHRHPGTDIHHMFITSASVCAASLNDCIALFSELAAAADRHQSSLTAADVLQQTRTVWFGRDFYRSVDDIHLVPGVTWLKSVLISSSRRRIRQNLPACQCRNRRSYREANKAAIGRQTNRMMAHWVIRSSRTTAGNSIPCAL